MPEGPSSNKSFYLKSFYLLCIVCVPFLHMQSLTESSTIPGGIHCCRFHAMDEKTEMDRSFRTGWSHTVSGWYRWYPALSIIWPHRSTFSECAGVRDVVMPALEDASFWQRNKEGGESYLLKCLVKGPKVREALQRPICFSWALRRRELLSCYYFLSLQMWGSHTDLRTAGELSDSHSSSHGMDEITS